MLLCNLFCRCIALKTAFWGDTELPPPGEAAGSAPPRQVRNRPRQLEDAMVGPRR
jgi:hypothetical protein